MQTESSLAEMQFMPGGDSAAFDMDRFRSGFDIEIVHYEDMEMTFHMKGVSLAVSFVLGGGGVVLRPEPESEAGASTGNVPPVKRAQAVLLARWCALL